MDIDIYVIPKLENETNRSNNRSNNRIYEKKAQENLIELFKIEKVSIRDCFYDLGGNSLKLIRLINYIEKYFKVRLKIKEVMQEKTVEDLRLIISKANNVKKIKYIS